MYMRREGHHITRAQFEENLAAKLANRLFTGDIGPLLSGGQEWNMKRAVAAVSNQLIARLPGDPWAPLSTD